MTRKKSTPVVSAVETEVVAPVVVEQVVIPEVVVEPEVPAEPEVKTEAPAEPEAPVVVPEPVVKAEKNQGVGVVVKKMIADGMSNKDILIKLEELYGNKQTTYACVAWYRNKMKKTGGEKKAASALDIVQRFLATSATVSQEEGDCLLESLKSVA